MNYHFNWRILLIRLFFPLAYAGFFAVQFFINFDTTLSGSHDRYQVIKCRVQTNIPVALQKANNDHPVKTKFRLNKRFQPAVVPSLPDMSGCPVIRDISVIHLSYVNPFVADPLLDVRLLRGPPFDALFS
jgi:hypothetical protein